MKERYSIQRDLSELPVWNQTTDNRRPFSFDIELTPRCNLDCRHCYINLPPGDKEARKRELKIDEINDIADQAVSLGVLWCLITGGEPLLRKDFSDIYMLLKKKGLLVSVFTNACLINEDHIRLFKRFPPRDIEITVYGVREETYQRVTRQTGSYQAFRHGLEILISAGVKVRLKAMALRSNLDELPEIARFCREYTKDFFRFDPMLHLRYDGNEARNAEIRAERLSPDEIVAIEQADDERADSLSKACDRLILPEVTEHQCSCLFHCGVGNSSFTVGYDGTFRLCSSLLNPDCTYDLRQGCLKDAWYDFVPKVRALTSTKPEYLTKCHVCPVINLCLWCPAHAYLESGQMDSWSEYFCQVAHARAHAIQDRRNQTVKLT